MTITHSQGSYPVQFSGIQAALDSIPSDSFVITDENVKGLEYDLDRFDHVYVLPPGERTKSLEFFEILIRWLAISGANRKSTIVALGGGVIGDLVGFVAAAYMRGVAYTQVPTTLLSQVDSSVGGKVAVDLPEGKNLVGAFYPPKQVWICTDILHHLPDRQFTNGMAEVLKYGFSLDLALHASLERELPIQKTTDRLQEVVQRCIAIKAAIVEEDEFETKGLRALLNFGHTVGHAIEQITEYGPLLHGEAIAIGMVAESRIGERLGISKLGTTAAVEEALVRQGLPVTHELLSQPDLLLPVMRRDKKAGAGKLAFSLVTTLGASKLVEDVPQDIVVAGLVNA